MQQVSAIILLVFPYPKCLCLCVMYELQQCVTLALSLTAAPQKVTHSLLTNTTIAVAVFFQLLDSAAVSVAWALL